MQIARCNQTIFISLSALFLFSNPAFAQLIPDNTLGGENSRVVPVSNTRDNIEGGATRGSNLFHSFREFNVNRGREVYFNNPAGVQNIINRVTGNNISNIFGTLGVNGNANLYLINPNGIVFGDGAFLDINGTFIGTTADGVRLGTNDFYSATDPANSSLLTIQPGALFVNRFINATRTITNQGNLEANPGSNLTLSADEINNNGSINVPGGNVLIEANGDINTANIIVDSLFVNGEATGNGGNISLVSSGNINVFDGSEILSIGILGGNINITSLGDLRASNAAIASFSTGNVIGFGGDINVNVRSIELDNSFLFSSTSGRGNGGNLNITAKNIQLIRSDVNGNLSGLFAQTEGAGNAGNLTIETDTLRILDGAQILAGTNSGGNGGNLNITAKNIEAIGVDSDGFGSGLLAQSNSGATGDAGNLTIETDTLRIRDGAVISASTFSRGNGGNLNITAKNIAAIGVNPLNARFPSGLFTSSNSGVTGNAGNLTIKTDTLSIRDGAQISAGTFSGGNGGNLTVTAKNIEAIGVNPLNGFPSALLAQSNPGATGNAGNLTIDTDTLSIRDGAQISASTFSRGNGGNLNITAKNIAAIGVNPILNNVSSGLFTQTQEAGNAGELTVTTNNLLISDRAVISAATLGTGNGSNINLFADNIIIENNGTVKVLSRGDGISGNLNIQGNSIKLDRGILDAESNIGAGGNIDITLTESLTLANSSRITAAAGVDRVGTGNGGNITIQSPLIIALPRDNEINANAFGGTGGNINITTNAILGYPQFLSITASSELGIDGTINITGISDLNTDLLQIEPVIIADNPVELSQCPLGSKSTELASAANDLGSSERLKLELFQRNNSDLKENTPPESSQPKRLQPSVGWYRRTDGTVVLTANPAEVRPLDKPIDYPQGCPK